MGGADGGTDGGNPGRGLSAIGGMVLVATVIGAAVILFFALAVPLEGLAELTSQGTLVIFAIVNLALIRIKLSEAEPPSGVFVCAIWVPIAGLTASVLLLLLDIALFS